MNLDDIEYFVGIDVAKDTIAVYFSKTKKYIEIENRISAFNKRFKNIDNKKTLVVIETTGGYENECLKWLYEHGIAIFQVDNKKFKKYKDSFGNGAKTDKIDATMLAKYGKTCKFEGTIKLYEEKDCEVEKIKQMVQYISELKATRAKEKNKLKSPGLNYLKDLITETIEMLTQHIKKLEKELKEHIAKVDGLQKKVDLLCEYKGIGAITALTLLTKMPELGKATNRQISALGGLAPRNRDSGTQVGVRTTRGSGRPFIKQALYMAAMSASLHNENIKKLYERLRSKGKRRMVALTACMHKILIHVNAILRDGIIKSNEELKNISTNS